MRLKSSVRIFTPFLLFVILSSAARTQAQQMLQPAPELKKLDYFVGNWTTDSEMKSGPGGAGGKVTGTDQVEWMDGKFWVVIHTKFSGSTGSGVETAFMGYDPDKKVYTFSSYNSAGEHESATGTLQGDTWVWNNDSDSKMHWRYTEAMLSPSAYSIKFEMSQDGKAWATVMEGKATKQ